MQPKSKRKNKTKKNNWIKCKKDKNFYFLKALLRYDMILMHDVSAHAIFIAHALKM